MKTTLNLTIATILAVLGILFTLVSFSLAQTHPIFMFSALIGLGFTCLSAKAAIDQI